MIDQEQDWINKYRAALAATVPAKQSRIDAFSAQLSGLIENLILAIGRAFRDQTIAELDVVAGQDPPGMNVSPAVAPAPSAAKRLDGPGTRSPGKRHYPRQDHRLRAS